MRLPRPGSARGFTLMETLVMLMLVSFAVLLMFQMLGSYRVARERVAAQAGEIDRRTLFDAWFLDSVRGLHPLATRPFAGTATHFSGFSLNPLFAAAGAPVALEWTLESGGDGQWTVTYSEDGKPRWSLPLADTREARFVYLDSAGEPQEHWPPDQGVQAGLPVSVALVQVGANDVRTRVASVRGPLEPSPDIPFEIEQD
jgi:type II secretory pathway pseudopilin PulG